jgi:hypothetical protein
MIHSLEGDLLLSKAELLAHGVAPNDDFKQGLARALREKFPAMYKDFRHHCHQSTPKCGTGTSWPSTSLWWALIRGGARWATIWWPKKSKSIHSALLRPSGQPSRPP